jgi:hypothetical protein
MCSAMSKFSSCQLKLETLISNIIGFVYFAHEHMPELKERSAKEPYILLFCLVVRSKI